MAQTYDYSKIENEDLRKRKALDDVRFWLGKQFKPMSEVIQEEIKKGTTRATIEMNINIFLGFSGYPVGVWLDELGVPSATPNTPSGTAETQAPDSKLG